MNPLRAQFLLDPQVVYLNHGAYGACPRPVFEVYQAWQKQMERQPVEFLGRRAQGLLADARAKLAEFVGAAADQLVYFSNPTTAVNMIVRSMELGPGDEILTTDHEYGAMDRTWRFNCLKTGAQYIQRSTPLPLTSQDDFVERLWGGVTKRTRVIFISHITSPTALIFPIAEICRRARQAGIITIIDGAHAPGQIHLDLAALEADLYVGACHKWLCAPKGSAFLYAGYAVQSWLKPLVVSWGYESEKPSASQFVDFHEWQGTRDLAAFLSVPAAIEFQAEMRWEEVRQHCHALASRARSRLQELTGLGQVCPDGPDWYAQMFTVRLSAAVDLDGLKQKLIDNYSIEIPTILWNGQKLLRVSIQGYNDDQDVDRLVAALKQLLPRQTRIPNSHD